MNETIEMKTPDIKYSKSECLKYQGVTVFNDNICSSNSIACKYSSRT